MASPGVGLGAYGDAQEQERQRQIEETKRIEEEIQRQAEMTALRNQQAQSGQQGGFGSFMSNFSGQVDPSTLQGLFSGGGGAGASGISSGASYQVGGGYNSAVGWGGTAGGGASGGGGGWGLGSLFGGGGGAAGGGAAGGSAAGGSAAGGGASGAGGGMAAGGMWAALAAAIMVNEYNAKKGGYRSDDDKQYAKDLLGGKVLEQDFNQRWLPKMYGKDLKNDKTGIGHDQKAFGEFMTFDFKNGFKALEDGTVGKMAKGIKKLF